MYRLKLPMAAFCGALFLFCASAWAAEPTVIGGGSDWQFIGPEGGILYSLYATEESTPRLVARGNRNLYRSLDAGETWEAFVDAPLDGYVPGNSTVALPSQEPNTIYALSANAQLLRSEDFGDSWSEIFAFEPNPDFASPPVFTAVAVDPHDSSRIFLYGVLSGFNWRETFRWYSSDRGKTWNWISMGGCRYSTLAVREVKFSKSLPRYMIEWATSASPYAGCPQGGLWVFRDGFFLRKHNYFRFLDQLAYEPAQSAFSGSYLYAMLGGYLNRIGLESGLVENLYQTGSAFTIGLNEVLHVATARGLRRSLDNGGTWNDVPSEAPGLGRLEDARAMMTLPDGRLIAAATVGAAFSDDSGQSWQNGSAGIREMRTRSLAVDATSGTVWAGHWLPRTGWHQPGAGILRTRDDGSSWDHLRVSSLAWGIGAVKLDRSTLGRPGGARLIATGAGCRMAFPACPDTGMRQPNGGIYFSDDDGDAFVTMDNGVPGNVTPYAGWVSQVSLDPGSYANGTLQRILAGGTVFGFFPGRTENAGLLWTLGNGLIASATSQPMVFDPHVPGRVFAGSEMVTFELQPTTPAAVYRSLDGGANWSPSSSGLPLVGTDTNNAQSTYGTAVDATTPGRVWTAIRSDYGETRVYRSDDGADYWYGCGATPGARFLDRIVQDPDRPSRILVTDRGVLDSANVYRDGAVWYSDNRCLTWHRLGGSLAASVFELEIANGKVYAATDAGIETIELPQVLDPVIFLSSFDDF